MTSTFTSNNKTSIRLILQLFDVLLLFPDKRKNSSIVLDVRIDCPSTFPSGEWQNDSSCTRVVWHSCNNYFSRRMIERLDRVVWHSRIYFFFPEKWQIDSPTFELLYQTVSTLYIQFWVYMLHVKRRTIIGYSVFSLKTWSLRLRIARWLEHWVLNRGTRYTELRRGEMDSLERLISSGSHQPALTAATRSQNAFVQANLCSVIGRKGRHLTGTFCLTGDTMEGIIQCLVFLKAFSVRCSLILWIHFNILFLFEYYNMYLNIINLWFVHWSIFMIFMYDFMYKQTSKDSTYTLEDIIFKYNLLIFEESFI